MKKKRPLLPVLLWGMVGLASLCAAACVAAGGLNVLWGTLINYDVERFGSRVTVGQPAPDFTLASTGEQHYTLSHYHGRPVLVHFFTTWCPPCKLEMPVLKDYYFLHHEEMAFLAVDEGDSRKSVKAYLEEQLLTFPVLLDPGLRVGRLYSVTSYPTSIFVDANGNIAAIHVGMMGESEFDQYLSLAGLSR